MGIHEEKAFFDQEKNVEEYCAIAEGFDGKEPIVELKKHLKLQSSLLELGMGPGKDLDLLGKLYEVTGSDRSKIFVNKYKANHPQGNVCVLDAVTIDINHQFEGIYSNKVLIHLTLSDLTKSISRQVEILTNNGIICHSFWRGEKKEENFGGLLFRYYTQKQVRALFKDQFEILELKIYTEMEPDDSILLIARKK